MLTRENPFIFKGMPQKINIVSNGIGNWEMEITNTEGKAYKFRGSLCANFEVDGVDLSDLIRDSLEIDDLYVFDGRFKPDKESPITIENCMYRRTVERPKPIG